MSGGAGPSAGPERPPLRPRELQRAVVGARGWRTVEVVSATASTNADLAVRARAGEPAGLVLTTDDQTGGRGRLGRAWATPPRSAIAVSVLLRPRAPMTRWAWLAVLAGLAVTDVLNTVCAVPAVLKWPNDVLIRSGEDLLKICGILAEVVVDADGGSAVVLGTGINVSQRAEELPVPTATSLALSGAATTDRDAVLAAYLGALAVRYRAWDEAGGDPRVSGIAAEYRRICTTIGREVRIDLPGGGALHGTAEGVDDDGRLLVLDAAGALHPFAAGDVVHVRAAQEA